MLWTICVILVIALVVMVIRLLEGRTPDRRVAESRFEESKSICR